VVPLTGIYHEIEWNSGEEVLKPTEAVDSVAAHRLSKKVPA